VPKIELERTLVKSPPELWAQIGSDAGLSRWLGEVRVLAAEAPNRVEWDRDGASGVIELESSGWGTKVRAQADPGRVPAWERVRGGQELERCLRRLLDDLGSSSLTSGKDN
jgi:hypothetical protein